MIRTHFVSAWSMGVDIQGRPVASTVRRDISIARPKHLKSPENHPKLLFGCLSKNVLGRVSAIFLLVQAALGSVPALANSEVTQTYASPPPLPTTVDVKAEIQKKLIKSENELVSVLLGLVQNIGLAYQEVAAKLDTLTSFTPEQKLAFQTALPVFNEANAVLTQSGITSDAIRQLAESPPVPDMVSKVMTWLNASDALKQILEQREKNNFAGEVIAAESVVIDSIMQKHIPQDEMVDDILAAGIAYGKASMENFVNGVERTSDWETFIQAMQSR